MSDIKIRIFSHNNIKYQTCTSKYKILQENTRTFFIQNWLLSWINVIFNFLISSILTNRFSNILQMCGWSKLHIDLTIHAIKYYRYYSDKDSVQNITTYILFSRKKTYIASFTPLGVYFVLVDNIWALLQQNTI